MFVHPLARHCSLRAPVDEEVGWLWIAVCGLGLCCSYSLPGLASSASRQPSPALADRAPQIYLLLIIQPCWNYPQICCQIGHSYQSPGSGKNNIIKMVILPKFLYLFRVLPIHVPAHFLRNIQQKVKQYTWGKTNPRLPRKTLYLPKVLWGLGFPNFSLYYRAAQLAQLSKYHSTLEIRLWVIIEAMDCDPFFINNLLWLRPVDRKTLKNPITKHSLSIWDRHKISHGLLLSFHKNPAFYPAWIFPTTFRA